LHAAKKILALGVGHGGFRRACQHYRHSRQNPFFHHNNPPLADSLIATGLLPSSEQGKNKKRRPTCPLDNRKTPT
jgi:hypothetical protein